MTPASLGCWPSPCATIVCGDVGSSPTSVKLAYCTPVTVGEKVMSSGCEPKAGTTRFDALAANSELSSVIELKVSGADPGFEIVTVWWPDDPTLTRPTSMLSLDDAKNGTVML